MSHGIEVPLELEDFEVICSELVEGTLEVRVRATFPAACFHCGSMDVSPHALSERRIRDRTCVFPTVLVWAQRRFACRDCGRTSRERHPQVAGRRSITNRFRRRLFERAVQEPFFQVASSEAVSSYRVIEAFEHHAQTELDSKPIDPPRVVSLDESAFRRPRRFHTVLSDPERGAVIEMVEGNDKASARACLMSLSEQVRASIETVVTDLFWPFRKAAEQALPNARLVADKFHVLRSVDTALNQVRRRTSRLIPQRARTGGRGGVRARGIKAYEPTVARVRWLLLKPIDKLTAKQRSHVDAVLASHPELRMAWMLKQSFGSIYQASNRLEAERRLDAWANDLEAANILEFTNLWPLILSWREPILAYFDDPVTNAFAEGITNKIKLLKRMSYGFRNKKRYRQKVLLACRRREGQR